MKKLLATATVIALALGLLPVAMMAAEIVATAGWKR